MIPYEAALRERMVANLRSHDVLAVPPDERRRAAVAIVVVPSEAGSDPEDPMRFTEDDMKVVPGDIRGFDGSVTGVAGGAAFLLCRRAAGLNRHGGQWALPGGRVDAGEKIEQTALREMHEELGVLASTDDILGTLDDYPTRSGYLIAPVVVWLSDRVQVIPNPQEVAAAYRIKCSELFRPDSPEIVPIPESDRPIIRLPLPVATVNAPTAAVLYQFKEVALAGRDTRVEHYEQPVFAWR